MDREADEMKAVILAAGFGKRLRPLTDYLPKVLMPILGVPAIDHVLKRLLLQGVRQVGVNAHYRSGQVRSHLESTWQKKNTNEVSLANLNKANLNVEVCVAHEEEILGTGGAIYNFRDFIRGEELFWVHNGDIISDIDLASALHFHQARKPLATLILWDYPPINTVSMDREGNITSLFSKPPASSTSSAPFAPSTSSASSTSSAPSVSPAFPEGGGSKNPGCSSLTFTGISILSPRILDYLPEGYSEMPAIYQSILESQGQGAVKICGFRGKGRYWADFGTISSYLNVHRDLLLDLPLNNLPFNEAGHPVGCVYRSGTKIVISHSADLWGFVSIGDGCIIEDGVSLKDCVVWPGTRVQAGTQAQRAVLGEDFICREY